MALAENTDEHGTDDDMHMTLQELQQAGASLYRPGAGRAEPAEGWEGGWAHIGTRSLLSRAAARSDLLLSSRHRWVAAYTKPEQAPSSAGRRFKGVLPFAGRLQPASCADN